MDSPVPASMFAPEPSSPGAARAAAAAARLHGGFDSDCSEDGEALNGEPELDLTSKLVLVSPTSEQYDSLLRQMWERMDEGCGETIYVIGQGSGEHSFPFLCLKQLFSAHFPTTTFFLSCISCMATL